MDSSRLLKRIAVFVAAYLAVSTLMAYFLNDDNATSITDTVEYLGKETTIKVLFEDEAYEGWAYNVLDIASSALPFLIDGFDEGSPYSTLIIEATNLENLDGYPFELSKNSNTASVATDYSQAGVVWALSQMWVNKGNNVLPEWVIWGESAYFAYYALGQSYPELAGEFASILEQGTSSMSEPFALDGYDMPGNAYSEKDEFDYFLGTSFKIYDNLAQITSIETLAEIHNGVFSTLNHEWDSERYITYVSDKTSKEAANVFEPVISGDIDNTVSRWKLFRDLEYIGALLTVLFITLFAFWGQVKKRFSGLALLRERNPIKRQLLKKYGSYDRIMMELESYFKRRIPDDQIDTFIKKFYQETNLKNNTN